MVYVAIIVKYYTAGGERRKSICSLEFFFVALHNKIVEKFELIATTGKKC
jgi:hypothetical protein